MGDTAARHSGIVTDRRSMRPPAEWLKRLAATGLAAKGVVYLLIGVLAVQAALGGGTPEGSEGALRTIGLQPFGRVLLGLTAAGLAAYVLWRLADAILNPEGDGAVKRIAHAVVAFIYAGIAVEAVRLVLGSAGGGADQRPADWTARLLSMPFGPILVGAVAVGIGGYGLYQLYKAWTVDFRKDLDLGALRRTPRHVVIAIGRLGLAARGIVLLLVAWFLMRAALQADPGEARGLAGALRSLQGEAYGPILLGVTAAGLIAYGLYQLVRSRYERIGA